MSENTREELQDLSSQFLEIFIQDLLVKNKVSTTSVKESMSEEQKQRLKQTVDNLKIQVEGFLENQTSVKKETAAKVKKQAPTSPLRESFRSKESEETEDETSEEEE